jgi:hypothetical protein
LPNILTHYTLSHVNKFLGEIDNKAREQQIESIVSARISQADKKPYKEAIQKLEQAAKLARRIRGQRERAGMSAEERAIWNQATPEARATFESRHLHEEFSMMSKTEQEEIKQQQSQMWTSVPPEFRAKAEAMLKRPN